MGYACVEPEPIEKQENIKPDITETKETPHPFYTELDLANKAMSETSNICLSSLSKPDNPSDWYNKFKEHEETWKHTTTIINSYMGRIDDDIIINETTKANNTYNSVLNDFLKIYTLYYFEVINRYEELYADNRQQYIDGSLSNKQFTNKKNDIIVELKELEKDEYIKSEAETVRKSIEDDYESVISTGWWSSLSSKYKIIIFITVIIIVMFIFSRYK